MRLPSARFCIRPLTTVPQKGAFGIFSNALNPTIPIIGAGPVMRGGIGVTDEAVWPNSELPQRTIETTIDRIASRARIASLLLTNELYPFFLRPELPRLTRLSSAFTLKDCTSLIEEHCGTHSCTINIINPILRA